MTIFNEEQAAFLAKTLAAGCVRNTHIENVHAGDVPLDDENMKIFMKQVVDKLYTVLLHLDHPKVMGNLDFFERYTHKWDEAELDERLLGSDFNGGA